MSVVLIGESLDCWTWEEWQVQEALDMWRGGYSILEISDRLARHEFHVAILIMDQIKLRKTIMRPEGLVIESRRKLDRPKRERGQI